MSGYVIASATLHDIPSLLEMLNRAYRGNAARGGWTHEADLIEGEHRTDAEELTVKINNPSASLLKYIDQDGHIHGCVYLEKKDKELYLGMLSVEPMRQSAGIGKKLLDAAEQYARHVGCNAIVMTVISVRNELIDWYRRQGYQETGVKEPFPDDPRYGKPRQPLFFKWLKKELK